MGTLTKANGMKVILIYLSAILMLSQNVGDTISVIKFLISLRTYGMIITSWEAQKEFLFLVPDLMLMPFLI